MILTFQLLIFSPLMTLGALGIEWTVEYSKHPCAVKGSTVFMNGTYTHPTYVKVTNRFWVIDPVKGVEATDLRNESGYSGRVEYLGDEQNHFSLRLSDVNKSDEHDYCIRVKGNKNYLFYPGIILRVTELRVEAPETVVEGNVTVLLCDTTCSPSDTPAFIWYKDDIKIIGKNISGNTLILKPTKAGDAGSYSCAVRGYEDLRSPAQNLSVKYRPRNISVYISPSGEIVEGSSVTLTCSADANPPVENYTWFKGLKYVGNEKTYTISKISIEDSGDYKCKCINKVGHQYSINVTLPVTERQRKSQTALIAVINLCLAALVLFILIVLLRKKKMFCWSEERPFQPKTMLVNLQPVMMFSMRVFHTRGELRGLHRALLIRVFMLMSSASVVIRRRSCIMLRLTSPLQTGLNLQQQRIIQ
ncbi:B-cell receptor CD22-like [Silurus meridionalis]|uniref:B-cell receptor CD22-like n=1 Tax=Silurus meridionalis TaxID=175797 RepID=UPI001EEAEEC7|nr:B-cell receptor CD22-like [Silurus meridionalis]